jgi:hypothetical protein
LGGLLRAGAFTDATIRIIGGTHRQVIRLIIGMYGAARWYDRRQKSVEILPEERIDDRLR